MGDVNRSFPGSSEHVHAGDICLPLVAPDSSSDPHIQGRTGSFGATALSDETFGAAWEAGRAMSYDEAVAYALEAAEDA
jgi:hypothetical protein